MGFPHRRYTIASIFCVLVAWYSFTTIVPPGYSQPALTRTILTVTRFFELVLSTSTSLGLDEIHFLRALRSLYPHFFSNHSDVQFYDTKLDTVPVRIYQPVKQKTSEMRGVIFFHGGGWSMWDLDAYHSVTLQLAKQLQDVVISVDYRLAPEYPFPHGLDDCVRVTKFFTKHAPDYGVNPKKIVLFGDSAGGNLAAAVSLRLRDEGFKPSPILQVLVYPVLQGIDFHTPSYLYNKDGPLLTKRLCLHYLSNYMSGSNKYTPIMDSNNHVPRSFREHAWKHYLNSDWLPDDDIKRSMTQRKGHDRHDEEFWNEFKSLFSNPYMYPLHGDDLSRLPHTYMSSCQQDPLRDDNFFFVHRLNQSGVKVTHDNLQVCFHGWVNMVSTLDTAYQQLRDIASYIELHV